MPKTKDALKILDKLTGRDAELRQMINQATVNARIAQLIYGRVDVVIQAPGK